MTPDILLTSFQTWRPDQPSNASDDLLQVVAASYPHLSRLRFLRRLPVHFEQASQQAIAAIEMYTPTVVVCCGMGEPRHKLGLESTAVKDGQSLQSPLPLTTLTEELKATEISHDAGRFVCNRLYYDVLDYLRHTSGTCGLFIHVPKLTPQNCQAIATDFMQILDRLSPSQVSYPRHNSTLSFSRPPAYG
ncbi:MAG: hypothetical protein WBA10_05665, partial [Elainellaceae cyanobacterium]